jgi:hypothetical protein
MTEGRIAGRAAAWHARPVSWEPPFEDNIAGATIDALFEINAKLADIREHLSVIRVLLGDEDDGEAEEG